MLRSYFLASVAVLLFAQPVFAQEDGQPASFRDAFLDDLAGQWIMQGHVMHDSVEYRADARWVLGHHFLRLRMEDTSTPPAYGAHVYIGYDDAKERYVAHWLDTFGGSASETLGYGQKKGNAIRFVFEYPDGPFHTTFEKRSENAWRLLMRTQNQSGEWTTFAEYEVAPVVKQ